MEIYLVSELQYCMYDREKIYHTYNIMDTVFDDNVRNIIGSFHPSRPLLTNDEIYRKILEINPEFCIVRLRDRYRTWYNNKVQEGELCKSLKHLRFMVTDREIHSLHDHLEIRRLIGREHITKYEDPHEICLYYEDHITQAFEEYIKNYACNPSNRKMSTYSDRHLMHYYHVKEDTPMELIEDIDVYVNEIKEYEPSFGLSRLYYDIHEQYIKAKTLDVKYIEILTELLPKIESINYFTFSDEIYIELNDGSQLTIEENGNEDLYNAIVANLYHGVSTTEAEYYMRNKIFLDCNIK